MFLQPQDHLKRKDSELREVGNEKSTENMAERSVQEPGIKGRDIVFSRQCGPTDSGRSCPCQIMSVMVSCRVVRED